MLSTCWLFCLHSAVQLKPSGLGSETVWIIGDGHVRNAAQRAAVTKGCHLSLPNTVIRWFGRASLRWEGLVPFFNESLRGRAVPDILLINCGGNDLGVLKSVKMVNVMREDLLQLHQLHPRMKIIFSALPQRRQYSGKLEKARKFVNSVMRTLMEQVQGAAVDHPNIRYDNQELFMKDGAHFSLKGYDIFIDNLTNCLKTAAVGVNNNKLTT
ncbi:hypothetical protein WMY93_024698 [Mugilogobius chulae]|uniref:SGNH hydrolase-type esterase domain-containing protein n=1 Tax=Mugilogobius chulae TaxID=88201 RepID=A0AAW0N3N2_9GOBI